MLRVTTHGEMYIKEDASQSSGWHPPGTAHAQEGGSVFTRPAIITIHIKDLHSSLITHPSTTPIYHKNLDQINELR